MENRNRKARDKPNSGTDVKAVGKHFSQTIAHHTTDSGNGNTP